MPLTWALTVDKTTSLLVVDTVVDGGRTNYTELVVYGPNSVSPGTWALIAVPGNRTIAVGPLATGSQDAMRAEACEKAVQWFEAQAAKLRPLRDPP